MKWNHFNARKEFRGQKPRKWATRSDTKLSKILDSKPKEAKAAISGNCRSASDEKNKHTKPKTQYFVSLIYSARWFPKSSTYQRCTHKGAVTNTKKHANNSVLKRKKIRIEFVCPHIACAIFVLRIRRSLLRDHSKFLSQPFFQGVQVVRGVGWWSWNFDNVQQ